MKIDVKTTLNKMESGVLQMLDVRSPAEFESAQIEGAVNIPLGELKGQVDSLSLDGETILICESGMRAEKAYDLLVSQGFSSLSILEGGMKGWKRAGAPCKIGKSTLSIERQVRIAAGLLVAVGTGLGLIGHAGFFAIPGFVGCGLVYAGVTDSCAMGILIAQMPWNRA